jgi:hypothetical protein
MFATKSGQRLYVSYAVTNQVKASFGKANSEVRGAGPVSALSKEEEVEPHGTS